MRRTIGPIINGKGEGGLLEATREIRWDKNFDAVFLRVPDCAVPPVMLRIGARNEDTSIGEQGSLGVYCIESESIKGYPFLIQ